MLPFLIHLSQVIKEIWELGHNINGDNKTIEFQCQHADKLWINFKNTSDGFQADCLCEDGYTLSFHLHNELPLKQWIDKGFYPLHACVLVFLDCVTALHHCIGMDNLYTSVKFSKACFNNPKKLLIHGAIRKGMRGIPNCVIQEEQKKMKIQEEKCGKTKAAILVGN